MDEPRESTENEFGTPDSISPLVLPPAMNLASPDLPMHHRTTANYVSTDLNASPVDHIVDAISLSDKHKSLAADLERVQKHVEDLEQRVLATYREIDMLERQIDETNTRLKDIRREEVELVKLRRLTALLTDAQTDLAQAESITTGRILQSWIADLHRRLRAGANIIDQLTVQREQRKRTYIVAMLPKEWDMVRLFDIAEESEVIIGGLEILYSNIIFWCR